MLLCARAFALQNGQNLGWNYLPLCFARTGRRFWQNFLCPAAALPTIVLAVFARSCSADTSGKTRALPIPKPLFYNSLPREGRDRNAGKGREGFNELFTF